MTRRIVVAFILGLWLAAFGQAEAQEKIVSREQVDYVFKLNRGEWEFYVKNIYPGWKKTLTPHDTGTTILVYYPNKMAVYIQPFYNVDGKQPEVLIIGNLIPVTNLPEATSAIKADWQQSTKEDLGADYDVNVVYKKIEGYHIVDLMITKAVK